MTKIGTTAQRILALDLSIKCTGWAFGDGTKEDTEWGTKSFSHCPTLTGSHHFFRCWLKRILDDFCPDIVVVENSVCQSQHGNVEALLGMKVLAAELCFFLDYRFEFLYPSTVKSQFTGNGHSSKQDVQRLVGERFYYDAEKDPGMDGSDALALLWVWAFKQPELQKLSDDKSDKKRKRANKKAKERRALKKIGG